MHPIDPPMHDSQIDTRAGSEDGELMFALRCTANAVWCGRVDVQAYRDNWEPWPVLRAG